MTTLTTTPTVAGILPSQYGPLIIEPVTQLSVAMGRSTLVSTSGHSFIIPVLRDDAGASWVAEGAEITPTDAVFDELVITPAKVAGLSIISAELAADSNPSAQETVGLSIARSIAKVVDKAWQQTMAAPAPAGLTGITAPSTVDAGTAWSSTDPFAEAISLVEVDGGTVTAFIAHPTDVLALAKLKAGTELASPLFGTLATSAVDRTILGVPLISNNQAVPGVIWAVSRERTFVVLRSDVTMSVSTDAFFTSDRVAVKATMRVGFAFPAPHSVAKISISG